MENGRERDRKKQKGSRAIHYLIAQLGIRLMIDSMSKGTITRVGMTDVVALPHVQMSKNVLITEYFVLVTLALGLSGCEC